MVVHVVSYRHLSILVTIFLGLAGAGQLAFFRLLFFDLFGPVLQ
jgi:hypothetical protein